MGLCESKTNEELILDSNIDNKNLSSNLKSNNQDFVQLVQKSYSSSNINNNNNINVNFSTIQNKKSNINMNFSTNQNKINMNFSTIQNKKSLLTNQNLKEKDNNQNINQVSIKEGVDFLNNGALVSHYDLENDHHYIYIMGDKKLIGPPLYPRYFIPPIGWTAIALKVSKKYDSGDDKWLGNSNLDGEWYIGYHGVKDMLSINNIIYKGFRIGPRQYFEDSENINPLTKNSYPKCKEGVYFAQNIDDAKDYSEVITYSGFNYRVVFMVRLNPEKVRILNRGSNKDYMIVNGDTIDNMYGKPKIDEVRPYKILLIKE